MPHLNPRRKVSHEENVVKISRWLSSNIAEEFEHERFLGKVSLDGAGAVRKTSFSFNSQ